jgi:hypothetical protein
VSELRDLQRWMLAAIAGPDGVPADDAAAIVRGTGRLPAEQRLALYRRSHRLRLIEAMRVQYPGLRHMLGEELFDAFALDYLEARPSRSYTLQRLGEGFADHLAATRPDADAAPADWPAMMIDLARLERTFGEVYDGPGTEGEPPPAIPAEPHPGLTVEPAPCLRLVRSSFPAAPYLSAVRRGEDPPLPAPAESFVAVSRRDWVVTLTPLDARRHALLARLAGGMPLGTAGDWADVRAWAEAGFFAALHVPDTAPQELVTS